MRDILEKWASTVLAFITTAIIVQAFASWSKLAALEFWQTQVYPLEKQALLLERAQIAAKVEINEMHIAENEDRIDDLENELRRLRP